MLWLPFAKSLGVLHTNFKFAAITLSYHRIGRYGCNITIFLSIVMYGTAITKRGKILLLIGKK